jgi:hypothetical protein
MLVTISGLLCLIPRLEAQNSFTFLQSGFTQTLFGNAPAFFGGGAFAPNGDVWVDHCFGSGSPLTRFVLATTTPDGHGGLEHPQAAGSPFASNAGCGLTNHPDGTLYSNTSLGVIYIDPNTGVQLRPAFGPAGNALGITVDPQTNNIVYVKSDCRFTPTCTIVSINPATLVSSNFAVLPSSEAVFVDGIYFDPSGNFLFLSNRAPVFRMTVLDRSGTVVQNVAMTSEPDGIAFHVNPSFVVTNDTDGTMTRFDFPSNNFTLPPTQTVFASGGFRGDLTEVGADSCLYLTQNGTRFADNTTSANDSVVKICPNFVPPPGVIPATGSFVIGDLNAIPGDTVTFLGAQWAQDNAFSGGPSPNAFKGFTDTVPQRCGGNWTSEPGNSSNPPDTVPQFIAVIVSSTVNKSGATITGDIAKIVIVRTDSGYGPSPGQTGTGTVVAVVCP